MRRTLPCAIVAAMAALVLTLAAVAQTPMQPAPGAMAAPFTMPVPPGRLAPPGHFAPLPLSSAQTGRLRAMRSARLGFACNPVVCVCRGDADCNDMFGSTVCGGRAICIDGYCYCDRPIARLAR